MNRKKLLIITPGARPIFSGKPGAVELLIKLFILENEKQKLFDIDFVGKDKAIKCKNLKYAKAIEINDSFVSKNIRGFIRLFISSVKTSYEKKMISAVRDNIANYDYILIEGMPKVAIYLRPLTKAKIVTHIHSDTLQSIKKNEEQINESTNLFISVSNYISDRIRNVIPEARVKTVYNCQNQTVVSREERDEVKKKLGVTDRDRIILFVGRMSEQKGLIELIKAFNGLPKDDNRKLLVVANSKNSMGKLNNIKQGIKHWLRNNNHDCKLTSNLNSGYVKKTKRLIASNPNIIHVEYVSQDVLGAYYDIASILVMPSLYSEAFGNVLIEGGAHALPIIASGVGGIPEVVNSKTGILVDANDIITSLQEAIVAIENNPQKAIELSVNSKKMSGAFTVEKYYRKISEALKELNGNIA